MHICTEINLSHLSPLLSHRSKAETSKPAAPAKKAKADDESDEDDEADDVTDMPEIAPAPRGKGPSRRTSVSAESMDPNKMKGAKVADIAKTPEVAAELNRIVGKSPLLRALDAEQKDKIVRAFDGPKTVAPGENIITQGEIGDTFYLIEDGLVDVYIKKGGGDEIKVHTYKPGDAFGELAIMYNAPRAATCRAQSESKVWALDRTSFKVIVVAAAMIKRELYQGFLQKVPILATCNEMEIMTLADSLAEEKVCFFSSSPFYSLYCFLVRTTALTHRFSSLPLLSTLLSSSRTVQSFVLKARRATSSTSSRRARPRAPSSTPLARPRRWLPCMRATTLVRLLS